MSKNLHLSEGVEGREVNLWQTPTLITDMCLSYDKNGQPDGGMEGVMRRYEIWVRSQTDGVWKSKADLDAMRERINAHLEQIRVVKDPFFWGF
jgi:hypothetical protein